MKGFSVWLFLFFTGIGILACDKSDVEGKIKKDETLARQLRFNPSVILIQHVPVVLQTFLYRDFMPGPDNEGRNLLIAGTILTAADSTQLPGDFELLKQYVIKDNQVWIANYADSEWVSDFQLQGISRNGPEWGPQIKVDVVCEFRDKSTGFIYKLLAEDQEIEAVQ